MTNYSQSKIKSFRRCQKQYSFRADYAPEGLELVPKTPSLPLKQGTWMHYLLEAHYREWAGMPTVLKSQRGQTIASGWEEVHDFLTQEFNHLFDEERETYGPDLPDKCYRLFRSYLNFWGEEKDRYKVAILEDDRGPAIEFIVQADLSRWVPGGIFKGKVDLMVEDLEYGGLWPWDHKWVSRIPSPDERMMDPQKLLYSWALRKMGYDVRGFVNNYGLKKPPVIPPTLKRGTLTTKASLHSDYSTYVDAIRDLHGDKWQLYASKVYKNKLADLKRKRIDWFRRERVPVENDRVKRALTEFIVSCRDIEGRRKPPPRTYDFRCKFSCGYHDPCVAQFNGLDLEGLLKRSFEIVPERYEEGAVTVDGES